MKRNLISLALISASLLIGPAALAQGGPKHGGLGKHFAQLDMNHDGKVTRQEARTAETARFKALDLNKDGMVTATEAATARQQRQAKRQADRFAKLDKNKDGRLSKEEVRMPPARFQQLDQNRDGFLSQSEFSARKRPGRKDRGGPMWDRVDSNRDGKLTQQEITAAADRMFERLDTNKDGTITQQEMQAGKHGPKGGQRGHRQQTKKTG